LRSGLDFLRFALVGRVGAAAGAVTGTGCFGNIFKRRNSAP